MCDVCSGVLDSDSVTPFCDSCWSSALSDSSSVFGLKILRWVARIDE